MDTFTITLRGTSFQLTKDQVEFDGPNYFTSYFFGGFKEAEQGTRDLTLNRHPKLFELIYEHLSGYEIFPVADGFIPGMSTETVLKNLRLDAQFYGLTLLLAAVEDELHTRVEEMKPEPPLKYDYSLLVSPPGYIVSVNSRDPQVRWNGFRPSLDRYPVPQESLQAYLDQFKVADLGSQDRSWIPVEGDQQIVAVWENPNRANFAYALVKRR
ncbi:2142_t:CDS:1, partial [Acaulospora colombiana]